jgi:hypothetical protein
MQISQRPDVVWIPGGKVGPENFYSDGSEKAEPQLAALLLEYPGKNPV